MHVCGVQESGVMQLVVDEVISETLESDNLILQNLSANKHVQVPFRTNHTLLLTLQNLPRSALTGSAHRELIGDPTCKYGALSIFSNE